MRAADPAREANKSCALRFWDPRVLGARSLTLARWRRIRALAVTMKRAMHQNLAQHAAKLRRGRAEEHPSCHHRALRPRSLVRAQTTYAGGQLLVKENDKDRLRGLW